MGQRSLGKSCGAVGNRSQGEHREPQSAQGDNFGDRGHSHGVGAERSQCPNLRWSLVARTKHGCVNTLEASHSRAPRRLPRQSSQSGVVSFGQINESRARTRIVNSRENVRALEIQVVRENHETSGAGSRRDASCGASENECADARLRQHAHGERDLVRPRAFVEVQPPLENGHRNSTPRSPVKRSGVAFGCGARKVRDGAKRNLSGMGEPPRKRPESRAEQDADAGRVFPTPRQESSRLLCLGKTEWR